VLFRSERIVEQGHPVIIEALKQKREGVAVVIATGMQDAVCVVAIASFIAVGSWRDLIESLDA
jgi:hypothetical protein